MDNFIKPPTYLWITLSFPIHKQHNNMLSWCRLHGYKLDVNALEYYKTIYFGRYINQMTICYTEYMWWSWVLAVIGVAGIYFVGRKDKWGWFVLLFNECLWITYALITNQYGFIFSALAYAAVYIRSYIHWSKEPVNEIPL